MEAHKMNQINRCAELQKLLADSEAKAEKAKSELLLQSQQTQELQSKTKTLELQVNVLSRDLLEKTNLLKQMTD